MTKYKYYPNLYYNKDSDNEQDEEKEEDFDDRKDSEKKYEDIEEEKEPKRIREIDEDSPEMKLLPMLPKGGEYELQAFEKEKEDENEKEFDYAANIEKTKKLIKKLTKSHRPIKIDWNDLLEKVKDVDNANNRVIK